jgi:Flp pilus assembly protein TadB
MSATDPRPPDQSDWRKESQDLEAPAYLGRPFPGSRRPNRTGPSGALRGLIGLFSLIVVVTIVFFTSGNVIAGILCIVALVGIIALAVYTFRAEVRRITSSGPR